MAVTELERKRWERIVGAFIEARRPPAHIRHDLDLGFRVAGQSVEIFEIRPQWKRPEVKLEHAVARATYVKAEGVWRVYWQRSDLKWHRYDPVPTVVSLDAFVKLVGEDEHGCFWR